MLAAYSAFGTTLVVQVVTVPLYLWGVGVDAYGDWLVVSAVPMYLSLTDLGFSAVAATAATKALARNDREEARRLLCSVWLAVSVVAAAAIALIVAGFLVWSPDAWLPHLGHDPVLILAILLLWVLLYMQLGFLEAAFRIDGQFPRGIGYLSVTRLTELAATGAALAVAHDLLVVACTLLTVRMVAFATMYRAARRRLGWFELKPRFATRQALRPLVGPSVGYAGFTAGVALQNQGMLLLTANQLGPTAAVTYSTVRTLSGFIFQSVGTLSSGALPAITRTFARGDLVTARAQHRRVMRVGLAVGVAGCLGLGLLGQLVIRVWTGGALAASTVFLVAMASTTLADVPWQIAVNTLRAVNAHQTVGWVYLASCVASLGLATGLLPVMGLAAVPTALFLIDLFVTPVAIRSSRRLLQGEAVS